MSRTAATLAGSGVALCVLVAAHVILGRSALSAQEVLRVLTGTSTTAAHEVIVLRYRLPRVLVGIGAGSLLALSGALLQSVMRNPLAEPGTTGVGAGAALGVVTAVIVLPGRDVVHGAALSGAAAAGVLLYLLGRRSLAVAGILLGAVLGAVTSLLLVIDAQPAGVVLRWLIGSLNARTMSDWNALWPWWIGLSAAGLLVASLANVSALGDGVCAGLGLNPARAHRLLLAVAVAAAAVAVSAAGAVAFVGLMAPHLARTVVGGDYRVLIPVSMTLGGVGLCAADLLAFTVSLDIPGAGPDVSGVPVGAVTAIIGAPYLMWLIRRETR